MKRSDALKHISNKANITLPDADYILKCCEDLGMLPPESQYNEGMGRGWVTHNVWETESNWKEEACQNITDILNGVKETNE